ncbi:MAG: ASCH domain-containing protein, partial [Haliea sp.]
IAAELRARGIEVPDAPLRLDSYGDSPELSAELLELIRSGRKRAGASLLWAYAYEDEPLPAVGQVEVVLDHRAEPALLTRVTAVEVLPFQEVSAAYAAREGEGDCSLAYWRESHWAFFTRECARIGREPTVEMPVVCVDFELLAVVDGSSASES